MPVFGNFYRTREQNDGAVGTIRGNCHSTVERTIVRPLTIRENDDRDGESCDGDRQDADDALASQAEHARPMKRYPAWF